MQTTNKLPGMSLSSETMRGGFCTDTTEHSNPGFIIMSKKIEYIYGEKIGECIYLKEINTSSVARKALFECQYCNTQFIARISSVKCCNTKSCGCYQKKQASKSNSTHGMSGCRLYAIWRSMISRCYNKNYKGYKYWGFNGVIVCDEWLHNFKAYYDHVTSLPNSMKNCFSLDRINNNGNYEPGNMRWATASQQSINQRIKKNNTSGYTGVSFHARERKWSSGIRINNKLIYLGDFKDKRDAVDARNKYIITNNLNEYKIQSYVECTD